VYTDADCVHDGVLTRLDKLYHPALTDDTEFLPNHCST